jgi:uncharacterized protein (TIGR02453 family)
MNEFSSFSPAAQTFLRQLKRHNEREWFKARKEEFEALLQRPLKLFVEEMDVRLARLAPELHGDPKRSIFRIHRDTRFSKDKTPYKTHVSCWFTHVRAGHGVGAETHGAGAGYYFHFEPGASMVAAGIWMPPRPALASIRARIATRGAELRKILEARALVQRYSSLSEEGKLTRTPRGFDSDHPESDLLRHVSFTISTPLRDADMVSTSLPRVVEKEFIAMRPLVRWLNDALGYPEQEQR